MEEESASEVLLDAPAQTITKAANLTTTPFLTRFELARVIGTRALQISHGAKVQVDMAGLSSDAIAIALEELKAGKINMIIRRNLPNNRHECVRVSDLLLDESALEVL